MPPTTRVSVMPNASRRNLLSLTSIGNLGGDLEKDVVRDVSRFAHGAGAGSSILGRGENWRAQSELRRQLRVSSATRAAPMDREVEGLAACLSGECADRAVSRCSTSCLCVRRRRIGAEAAPCLVKRCEAAGERAGGDGGREGGEEEMATPLTKMQREELAGVEMAVWRGWRDRLVKRQ